MAVNYEIRVEGGLDPRWSSWFDGLQITNEPVGGTVIAGAVVDQAALHGLLTKIHNLGLPLIYVHRIDPRPPAAIVPLMAYLQLTTIIVDDYDDAIAYFTQALGFELVEDSPAHTDDGRAKRWVVVRPPEAETGILLARADGDHQVAAIGNQHAGRVGFFLRVDDFDTSHRRMRAAGVEFLTEPRTEPYGQVAVFRDIAGNRWDLLGPAGDVTA
jgi:catechol 2,3-dioxygenase-like lactoylglutathione lyase family enzyme